MKKKNRIQLPVAKAISKPTAQVVAKRQMTTAIADYETLFLKMEELKYRKSVYISKGMHEKITHIAAMLKNRKLSVGAYIENIIDDHLKTYKDEINTLYEIRTPKPLQ